MAITDHRLAVDDPAGPDPTLDFLGREPARFDALVFHRLGFAFRQPAGARLIGRFAGRHLQAALFLHELDNFERISVVLT